MSHHVSQRVHTTLSDLAFLVFTLRGRGVKASKSFQMPNNKAKLSPARVLYREGQCYDSMAQRDGHTTKILPHVRHRFDPALVLLSIAP